MRGIFLVSCFLGGSALLAGCRKKIIPPPGHGRCRAHYQRTPVGESRSALQNGNWTALPVLPFPFRMTCRPGSWSARRAKSISSLKLPEIRHVLNPTRKRFPRRELLRMVAIPGGTFLMGSPAEEPHRKPDEGPQHKVSISPFWISETEIPWELYTAFMENGRPRAKDGQLLEEQPDDELWDSVTQPTAPYTAMNLGMGHGYEHGLPAISMSHHAASKFCEWLSAQTGHYYRLPTEAEWEYACRAGNPGAYSYGNGEEALDQYAWYWDNSNDRYQKTGSKKPNKCGLRDMHGNVAEWVLTLTFRMPTANGAACPRKTPGHHPRRPSHRSRRFVGRRPGQPEKRCAPRQHPAWNRQDPQNPKSIWYLTDGGMIGFRVVRPMNIPDVITMHRLWNFSKGEP
ncbi:MAG: formylglycine-generating enzyme family protein [Akkermansia sp.]